MTVNLKDNPSILVLEMLKKKRVCGGGAKEIKMKVTLKSLTFSCPLTGGSSPATGPRHSSQPGRAQTPVSP